MLLPALALLLAQTAPAPAPAAAAPAPAPSAEAEALGMRLAETGTLAAMLRLIVAKESEELAAEHPDWSDADRAALRATYDERAKQQTERLFAAFGHGYAEKLSVEDLRVLVAFNEGPEARRWRDATPGVTIDAVTTVGDIDLKGDARKAFCAKTGKGCETSD